MPGSASVSSFARCVSVCLFFQVHVHIHTQTHTDRINEGAHTQGDAQNLVDLDRVSLAEARSVTYMSTVKERTQCDAKGKASVALHNRVLLHVLPPPPHTHTLTST